MIALKIISSFVDIVMYTWVSLDLSGVLLSINGRSAKSMHKNFFGRVYIRKKTKNANKKRKNENFEKQKNAFFFSCPKDHLTQILGSWVKRCAL